MTGPAMPDPGRLIRRSVAIAERTGMPKAAAHRVVRDVIREVENDLRAVLAHETAGQLVTYSWIAELSEELDEL